MHAIARLCYITQVLAVWVVITAAIPRRMNDAHSLKSADLPQSSLARGGPGVTAENPAVFLKTMSGWRGGATVLPMENKDEDDDDEVTTHPIQRDDDDAYTRLAHAIQSRLSSLKANNEIYDITTIVQALQSLSSSQQAFKGLDGAAHEAYQRTHSSGGGGAKNENVLLSVQGRARRSAARTSAVANALGACELCELLLLPRLLHQSDNNNNNNNYLIQEQLNQTLTGRQVLLNVTGVTALLPNDVSTNVSVLVLFEPLYQGGAGIHHGSIQDLATTTTTTATTQNGSSATTSPPPSKRPRGRLLIVIGDQVSQGATLNEALIRILEPTPKHVRLYPGPEVASVQARLYPAAAAILTMIEPVLRSHSPSCAIHFVGRSLSGGIAALAATILDGDIPMPVEKKKRKSKSQHQPQAQQKGVGATMQSDNSNTTTVSSSSTNSSSNATASAVHQVTAPLQGLGRGRTSALTLGAPPCLSANVPADFVTSILYGDDVVCRITPYSWERFLKRTQRALVSRSGGWGVLGSARARMADTWTLAASNLQSHAVGSQGEEARLALTGRAYLIRPRRLGGLCSMHEVGASQLKGGREALRAAVLWQINDVLLSRSLWKHHQLESYIHGLDRVQLRGLDEHDSSKDEL